MIFLAKTCHLVEKYPFVNAKWNFGIYLHSKTHFRKLEIFYGKCPILRKMAIFADKTNQNPLNWQKLTKKSPKSTLGTFWIFGQKGPTTPHICPVLFGWPPLGTPVMASRPWACALRFPCLLILYICFRCRWCNLSLSETDVTRNNLLVLLQLLLFVVVVNMHYEHIRSTCRIWNHRKSKSCKAGSVKTVRHWLNLKTICVLI